MGRHISVCGVSLEVEEQGLGRPLLFLHAGEGLQATRPWLHQLARHHRVIAPHHPGFGGSALPDWIGTATVHQLMDTETVFAGTPDDVFNQLQAFNTRMGGVGHLLFFGQGGDLSHQDTRENIRLVGQEVAPRLRELGVPAQAAAAE